MKRQWRLVLLVSLIGNLTVAYVGYKAYEYRRNINFWLDKYTYVVDEFSERNVYAQGNISLRSDTTVPGRVVFFGTQVIVDWPLEAYFDDYQPLNRGVSGQRAAGFLLRFRPDVVELGPEYVVIELSSYNFRPQASAKEMFDYVVSMAELSRANGIEPILTTCIPPRSDLKLEDAPNYIVKDTAAMYSRLLEEYAAANNFLIADFAGAVADSNGYLLPDLSCSEIDLNDRGYDQISAAISAVLNQHD